MVATRMSTGWFLMLFIVVAMVPRCSSLRCRPCDKQKCQPVLGCKNGLTSDICQCCDRCAKGLGEECGGSWWMAGRCAKELRCTTNGYTSKKGTCIVGTKEASNNN